MEKIKLWVITITIAILVSNCAKTTKDKSVNSKQSDYKYSVCLILDGSDRLSQQNDAPQLSIEQVIELAKTLAASGAGSLHVSFADGNAQNNKIASFCTSEKKLNFASVRRLKSYSRVIKGELYENYYCRCG